MKWSSDCGQLPNFVTVDFYSVGDLFDTVDTLNGLSIANTGSSPGERSLAPRHAR